MEGLTGLLLVAMTMGGTNTPNGPLIDGSVFNHDSGWLSMDKVGHFSAGAGASMVTRAILEDFTDWNDQQIFWAGCAASTAVGIAKEFYDRDVMGTYIEEKDIIWTAAGCLMRIEIDF